jgi:hypothetical protein
VRRLQINGVRGIVAHRVTVPTPRALVVLRVPRGAAPPDEAAIRDAMAADRTRLALPPAPGLDYRLAGPYPVTVDGAALDEYVAWEI